MKKKILILGLIVCSLFVVSMNSVVADETETITDAEDDVIDYWSIYDEIVYVSTVPNIDIINATYEKEDEKVTLTLTVKGEIENTGNLDESIDETLEVYEYVSYSFSLYTTNDHYYIVSYMNKQCQLAYSELLDATPEIENISAEDFSAVDDTLAVSFTLKDTDDSYSSLEVGTEYVKLTLTEEAYYIDLAPDDILDEDGDDDGDDDQSSGDGGDSGETDNNNDSGGLDNSAILIFIAIIAAICIIGVAVIIFVIRR